MPKAKTETAKKAAPKKAPAPKASKAAAPKVAPIAKSTKKPEPKVKLEVVSKKSEKIEELAIVVTEGQSEEDEDEMEGAAPAGASQSGLAMAAATADTTSGSFKNFRQHPDLENFYRFIFENDLRYEALEIIDKKTADGLIMKSPKGSKARAM